MRGTVVKSTGSWYAVKQADGTVVPCRIKGKFRISGLRTTNPLAVGDRVEFDMEDADTGVVRLIEPRDNYIIRKSTNLSKKAHIIAANLDQAVLMVTLAQPRTSTGFIDRVLVTAEAYHIPVLIVFNKADLYTEEELEEVNAYMYLYGALGYPCLLTSAESGEGIEAVRAALQNKTSLIAGHSGVGKSTLINTFEPDLDLLTDEISEWSNKGRHTTTFAEMYELTGGGSIIDSPGIKGFGLIDEEKAELAHRFPEMRERMAECRFNNCLHLKEPGCAIIAAVESGDIWESRYNNYVSMYNEDEMEKYR